MLINPQVVDAENLNQIEKILNICFNLYTSKNILIHNTSLVGIQELFHIIIDEFIKREKHLDN